MLKFFNGLAMRRIRRSSGDDSGESGSLILITIGRRSSLERQNPVAWFRAEGGGRLIVASAGGARGNPAWYYNIGAHPDRVHIQIGGRTLEVRAEQLHGAERERAWQRIVALSPRFASYQKKTDREIPVIRLIEYPS
ncbi:deazaflavin-dependent oxidoreductase (nitroreductase family) [Actinoplanes octamycinicus]|uniref:Deazaflavin-dependent oxidoreductase (Nitroreductase family) n=1 Tax=Actinoplanes octamycinicus TaxID=135948 RepID=A0A7W7H5F0_9ACTN|nr:nitroreductase/quinone reductase family protein [Actinoplanes octamycinicus]MBB4744164.1 deazaflavin-dependent oxidoreductase (nitroreductase family) [Actinoplanes octamycinicus]GIE56880.1 hypothetical protein Aoc01nite_22820 [Actinoplanes octamycinicus]